MHTWQPAILQLSDQPTAGWGKHICVCVCMCALFFFIKKEWYSILVIKHVDLAFNIIDIESTLLCDCQFLAYAIIRPNLVYVIKT